MQCIFLRGRWIDRRIAHMTAWSARTVELDAELLERARPAADERGVTVPQFIREALEHELGEAARSPGGLSPAPDEYEAAVGVGVQQRQLGPDQLAAAG